MRIVYQLLPHECLSVDSACGCTATIFKYCTYVIFFQDPFRRHFTIEDLTPFTINEISLAIFNEYTISVFGNQMSVFTWRPGILTSPGGWC